MSVLGLTFLQVYSGYRRQVHTDAIGRRALRLLVPAQGAVVAVKVPPEPITIRRLHPGVYRVSGGNVPARVFAPLDWWLAYAHAQQRARNERPIWYVDDVTGNPPQDITPPVHNRERRRTS